MSDLNIPASAANPDVDISEDTSPALIITCAVLLPLTWLAVGLRVYVRAWITKSFKIEDWFIVIAQFTFTVVCALILEGVRNGLGKHNAALAPDKLILSIKWQSLATRIYILDMIFVKLSIGIFLLRLAVWTAYKWILRICLVVFALWGLGLFFWNSFQCNPVEKLWDFRIEYGYCAGPYATVSWAIALSIMNILSDWVYALLPVPMVWNINMTKQAKITVIVLLGLGIFASIATVVRFKYLNGLNQWNDLSYSLTDAVVWTLIEPGVAILATSLATIRPLLRILQIKGFKSSDSSATTTTGLSVTEEDANMKDPSTDRGTVQGANNISDMSTGQP
ncbi:hypothetical protein HIM_07519 [Hirsutella minnesotensis 3608]|uniref:Rhodopsin domain-containing protein n=1 Tax=Hirsutella minnesotensis 3608 TaxID=1043627 RepID=A0A0F7ZN50_9HYPO|nr:hypothetical protein HIM_07519 [Hirsutella minnesotensis 3608]